jgi:hypothetical protein
MINFEVPSDCAFSPSAATPHLTINHDVAADLDSSNFEGMVHLGDKASLWVGFHADNQAKVQRSCSKFGSPRARPLYLMVPIPMA